MKQVGSKTVCWIIVLMLIVPGSFLFADDPPAAQGQAGSEARPAATTPVPPALHQGMAASLGKPVSTSDKTIPTPPPGSWGIVAEGDGGGGICRDSDSEAEVWLGTDGYGVEGFGSEAGGYFADSDGAAYAYVGYGDTGIKAWGSRQGGYFHDSDSTGYANVGYGNFGIQASGSYMGGNFSDSDSTGGARVGYGDRGIEAYGSDMGGYFADSDDDAFAYVGYAGLGIRAQGSVEGGYFVDSDDTGYAHLGVLDEGIWAGGSLNGGRFIDSDSSSTVRVAYSTYKIQGTGTVSFVQNHPYDPTSVIVYAAPEGDEVATYTRGTARLFGGEATVPLGETFKWVTNPDLGLTAFLTPVSEWCDLYVAEQATDAIVVRSRDGSDCDFNYLIYGLRIGFEESSIVQEKEQESYIPSMADHRQLYQRRPDLRGYNSLERFKGMSRIADVKAAEPDLSRAHALRDAIVEFDPAVQGLPGIDERPDRGERLSPLAKDEDSPPDVYQTLAESEDHSIEFPAPHSQIGSVGVPVDDEGNVYATSFRPSSQDLASLVDVSEQVQPGDVLVIDRDYPGMMRKAFEAHDAGVIGVVASDAGLVLGTRPDDAAISRVWDREIEDPQAEDIETGTAPSSRAAVSLAGVVTCNVDATYGAVWPGDLLVTSPTPGCAMRTDAPLPGTMLGKALEPLQEGVGSIKILVMLR